MHLRKARLVDLDVLVQLEQYFSSDRMSRASFRGLLRRRRGQIWMCECDGAAVGNAVVLYRRGTDTARIYSLVVHPDHRRRGIARALLQHIEAAAVRRRCRQMCLEVRPDNGAAIDFYRENGYETTERIAGFYEDGVDALKMRKPLAPVNRKASALSRQSRPSARGAPLPCPTAGTPAIATGSPRKSAAE